jgi:hypothetical protein
LLGLFSTCGRNRRTGAPDFFNSVHIAPANSVSVKLGLTQRSPDRTYDKIDDKVYSGIESESYRITAEHSGAESVLINTFTNLYKSGEKTFVV